MCYSEHVLNIVFVRACACVLKYNFRVFLRTRLQVNGKVFGQGHTKHLKLLNHALYPPLAISHKTFKTKCLN